jgi:hypothetical protein
VVGVTVLFAGWLLVVCLAITPLVVPALIGFRAAVGGLAWVEAELANALLDTHVRPSVTSPAPAGFWTKGGSVLHDGAFWKQQVYHLQRFALGGVIAVGEVTLLGAAVSAIATPVYYRWSDTEIGSWHVDTIGRALLWVPPGILALILGVYLLRPLRAVSRALVLGLLGGEPGVPPVSPAVARARRRRALALHAAAFVAVNGVLLLIWALTTSGYFWPMWTLLPLGLALGIHAWVVLVDERPELIRGKRMTKALAIHEGVAIGLSAFLIG